MGGTALAALLAACAPAPGGGHAPDSSTSAAELGYAPPPAAVAAARLSQGRVLISGTAPAATQVRLAMPSGQAVLASTSALGAWKLVVPPATEVRLFGLSALVEGRAVQAQGYLAVTPTGEVAQFGAGSGAVSLGRTRGAVVLRAADFDRKGGAVLSGDAPAGQPVTIVVDGAARGLSRADSSGRFTLALNQPLSVGAHQIDVTAGGKSGRSKLSVSATAPLTAGPFRGQPVAGGWRIDWLTPGGGIQSTVIFHPPDARQ